MDLQKNNAKEHVTLEIDTDYFEKIYHLRFKSFDDTEESGTEDPYRCYVACKKKEMKNVCLYNLSSTNIFESHDED